MRLAQSPSQFYWLFTGIHFDCPGSAPLDWPCNAVYAAESKDADAKVLGVLNAGIHLETFNGWLEIAERRPDGRDCPERFVLLLHRTQLIRHPCPDSMAARCP